MKATMKIGPCKNLMEWIKELDAQRGAEWNGKYAKNLGDYIPVTVTKGSKFVKILCDRGSSWGYVCMFDGVHKGEAVKKGDLMKSSGRAPAKGPRGNIFDGTAQFSYYGPAYRI